MKIFVAAKDEAGLRSVNAFLETEVDGADQAEQVALDFGYEVARFLGEDLRDVLNGHEAFFEETGRA